MTTARLFTLTGWSFKTKKYSRKCFFHVKQRPNSPMLALGTDDAGGNLDPNKFVVWIHLTTGPRMSVDVPALTSGECRNLASFLRE